MLNIYTFSTSKYSSFTIFLGLHFYEEAAINNLSFTMYIWGGVCVCVCGRGWCERRVIFSPISFPILCVCGSCSDICADNRSVTGCQPYICCLSVQNTCVVRKIKSSLTGIYHTSRSSFHRISIASLLEDRLILPDIVRYFLQTLLQTVQYSKYQYRYTAVSADSVFAVSVNTHNRIRYFLTDKIFLLQLCTDTYV
jgi:hypothetical protein